VSPKHTPAPLKRGFFKELNSPALDKGDEVEITLLFRPKPVRKTVSTAADLLRSDIVGLWKDRTDMEDSPEFARILREKSQRRF